MMSDTSDSNASGNPATQAYRLNMTISELASNAGESANAVSASKRLERWMARGGAAGMTSYCGPEYEKKDTDFGADVAALLEAYRTLLLLQR